MKCQRKKIDNHECLEGNVTTALYNGIRVCNLCYMDLTLRAKRLNYMNKMYATSELRCKKCGRVMIQRGQHNTGYCKECLKDRELFCQVLKDVRKIYK